MARFWCKIGSAVGDIGELKFGFYGPDKAYDGIGRTLGVTKIGGNNSARGIAFGVNSPKPPQVRISYGRARLGGGTGNDLRRSTIRYCDTDNLGRVLGGALNNNRVTVAGTAYPINSVSMAR